MVTAKLIVEKQIGVILDPNDNTRFAEKLQHYNEQYDTMLKNIIKFSETIPPNTTYDEMQFHVNKFIKVDHIRSKMLVDSDKYTNGCYSKSNE